jgi:hypothetical protein
VREEDHEVLARELGRGDLRRDPPPIATSAIALVL